MTKEILVVDDQAGIRMLLQEVFTDEGFSVTTAETGKEALDKIYAGSFDLLMLDYKLPVVDGSQVLKQLEHDQIFIPAIVMSGLAEDAGEELKHFGIIRKVFAKPFSIQEVSRFVKSILE
ncbi:two-component system, response regulator, stage 0 sporulation protein F [Lentibacillus halodurans]|uniref:Two-component system, response regulator, stage 0 sporulation protein F n=1 Tax=Lentibacillus halodurans TaxID=237679 RepID=A0A1I0ZKK0_9BACI|nr:response regulator [Lentibacillus halodurans]SFB26165.1 two-component system, response regulator, stage 0 sporulation protein F [Lentibacillus halodurans]